QGFGPEPCGRCHRVVPLGSKCLRKLVVGSALRFGFQRGGFANIFFLAFSQLYGQTIEQSVQSNSSHGNLKVCETTFCPITLKHQLELMGKIVRIRTIELVQLLSEVLCFHVTRQVVLRGFALLVRIRPSVGRLTASMWLRALYDPCGLVFCKVNFAEFG